MNERYMFNTETKQAAIHLEMDTSNVFSQEFREYTKRVFTCAMAQELSKHVDARPPLDETAQAVTKAVSEELTKDTLQNVLKAVPRLLAEVEKEVLDDPKISEKMWALLTMKDVKG